MSDDRPPFPRPAPPTPVKAARPPSLPRPPKFTAPTRDSVTTIREDGSRRVLFPADVRGRFTTVRSWSAAGLLVFYLALPWIKVGGYPAVFLDVAERRFHLFGLTLAAQDMWLMFFLITGVGFSLFFLTSLLGRVWCGWACPQTIFLEQVYRRIERWIDGDAVARRALDAAPMSPAKAGRRVLKHAVYLFVSAVFTHLFLAYFVSVPEVLTMVRAAPSEHGSFFVFMAAYTGLTYFIFAWFREQVCIVLCPYGRIQSALTDDHTLVIGYDTTRGEPRGGLRRQETDDRSQAATPPPVSSLLTSVTRPLSPAPGDCVDCLRCVQVCPTGIDIRQGLQIECIGCAGCIDACDEVMHRLHRPPGLIRYDSLNGFAKNKTRLVRPRTILYFALLLIGAGVTAWALSTVRPANFGITRMTGAPYFVDGGFVRDQFFVRLVNKRAGPARFVLQLRGAPAGVVQAGFEVPVEIAPLGEIVQPLVLCQARAAYVGPFEFEVRVQDVAGTFHLERKVEFLGPDARLLREEEAEEKEKHERK